jgi:hypothetical protein
MSRLKREEGGAETRMEHGRLKTVELPTMAFPSASSCDERKTWSGMVGVGTIQISWEWYLGLEFFKCQRYAMAPQRANVMAMREISQGLQSRIPIQKDKGK